MATEADINKITLEYLTNPNIYAEYNNNTTIVKNKEFIEDTKEEMKQEKSDMKSREHK